MVYFFYFNSVHSLCGQCTWFSSPAPPEMESCCVLHSLVTCQVCFHSSDIPSAPASSSKEGECAAGCCHSCLATEVRHQTDWSGVMCSVESWLGCASCLGSYFKAGISLRFFPFYIMLLNWPSASVFKNNSLSLAYCSNLRFRIH